MAKEIVVVQLGDRVKDQITGLTGIVTCITSWLNGCRRVGVQPEKLKDGKVEDCVHFDDNQLELVKKAVHEPVVLVKQPAPEPVAARTRGGPAREGANFRR